MAVKQKTLSWDASIALDVTGYKLFVEPIGTPVTAASQSHDLGNVTSVDLNTLLGNVDGTYNLGLAAYDDVGNEGPLAVINDVPLDFVAPDAPTNLVIT